VARCRECKQCQATGAADPPLTLPPRRFRLRGGRNDCRRGSDRAVNGSVMMGATARLVAVPWIPDWMA
jgi:hypothetical protein